GPCGAGGLGHRLSVCWCMTKWGSWYRFVARSWFGNGCDYPKQNPGHATLAWRAHASLLARLGR
ncbi:MAG: hypothetical protein AAFU56_09965, partial [Pseudomonadota bacterium]